MMFEQEQDANEMFREEESVGENECYMYKPLIHEHGVFVPSRFLPTFALTLFITSDS